MAVQTIIKKRRDTAANWASVNPVLAAGEEGYETDNRESKVGDGVTAWNSLPYSRALTAPDYETTVVSANGTKTLTSLSARDQYFTGSAVPYSIVLPDVTTLSLGDKFSIHSSNGGGAINIKTAGLVTFASVLANARLSLTCISTTDTSASGWRQVWEGTTSGYSGTGAVTLQTAGTLTNPVIGNPNLTLSTTSSTTAGRLSYTGSTIQMGNGTSVLTFSDNAANATTYAPISHTHTFANITDVNITSPTNGQSLTYDSATSKWINSAAAATGETISSFLLMGA